MQERTLIKFTENGDDYTKGEQGYVDGFINIENKVHAVVIVWRKTNNGKEVKTGWFTGTKTTKDIYVVSPLRHLEIEEF